MKANELLQVIFAIFLGIVVVAFVGIGVNTFYPEPRYEWTEGMSAPPDYYTNWQMTTSIILLVCATLILVVSLALPDTQAVLSNGVLLGGVFTMIYSVGMAASSSQSWLRLVVAAVALAATVTVGYFTFVRGRKVTAATTATPTAVPIAGEVGERIAAIEHKLDALGKALRD